MDLLGSIGGDGEGDGNDKEEQAEAERERLEALAEAEERRKEKHRKMEEEREKLRQGIRDKYGLKKKEEKQEDPLPDVGGGLNRKKKTAAELAAEAELEEQDDFTKFKNSLETQVNELKSTIEGKCVLQ
ncbi:CPLX1 (predicted) [Pycnogonum litorale]